MDIPIDANVSCCDGDVGKSTYIIVDLVTERVTHFVLKTDHPSKQFVVPIEKIRDTDRTVILLDCRKEDVYQLSLFDETHFHGYIVIEHRFKRIPDALVVLIYGIAFVSVFNLADQGVDIIGDIPGGLAAPQIPDIGLEAWLSLIPGAVAITLVMFSEAIGPDRSFASKHKYEIDKNQELIGIGAANIGAGLFQGFPIGASLSKSAASNAAGGKTQNFCLRNRFLSPCEAYKRKTIWPIY